MTFAQKIDLKTNLLYGAATLTPNLGAEVGLGDKSTLSLEVGYNPWNLNGSETNNKKLVHLLIEPEYRYWLKNRFNGHFFGVHALFAEYNVGGYDIPLLFEKEYRYEGSAYGGGLSYGYLWKMNPHWGMEFNVGLGVAYLDYKQYDCPKCGSLVGNKTETYFGPTKAGISLIYFIK